MVTKNSAREGDGFQKHSVCAAARAANVYNYKHKQRVARERAVLKAVTRPGVIFFLILFITEPILKVR